MSSNNKKLIQALMMVMLGSSYIFAKNIPSPKFDFKGSGIVFDDKDNILNGVKAEIEITKPTMLFLKDIVEKKVETVNGNFKLVYYGIVSLRINFTKDGYFPEEYHLYGNLCQRTP